MAMIRIRDVVIGSGRPKICAPIVGRTAEEIRRQAARLKELPVDVAEWRADWMDAVFDETAVTAMVHELRYILGDMPLLMTFRTASEGGEKAIDDASYVKLNTLVAASGCIDLLDVELMRDETAVAQIVQAAHAHDVKVIMSNHDFHRTPEKEVMLARLQAMEAKGADILKIAVMPACRMDVLKLLTATTEMSELTERPLITMSMGAMGVISRLSGETFGSAMTFGAAEQASAPGQIDVKMLRNILEAISL